MPSVVPPVSALAAAVVLALAHVGAGGLRFLRRTPRSRWLSVAGGVSVAYVFVHLLPELARSAESVAERFAVEEGVFAVALAGLVIFYGLERLARSSRGQQRSLGREDCTPPGVFWLHVATFTAYNAIVGYLLRERGGPEGSLALYTLAMALHFLVIDDGLRRHHRRRYERVGRWILGAAVLLGLGAARVAPGGALVAALLMAFLGGGVVLNVLKEEVPEEREARFGAFAAGACAYAALLVLVG